LKASKGC